MPGIATEALKDISDAEDRISAIDKELDHQRQQYEDATKELRAEKDEKRKLIASRLKEAAAEYSDGNGRSARSSSNGGERKQRTAWTDDMADRVVAFLKQQKQPVKIKAIKDDLTEQFGAVPSNVGTKVGDMADEGKVKKEGSLAQTTYAAA